jgi:hypothetical protein
VNDLEKFSALCSEFGLAPEVSVGTGEYGHPPGTILTFEKPQPKVEGYASSLAAFEFNPDGSFRTVGVWE